MRVIRMSHSKSLLGTQQTLGFTLAFKLNSHVLDYHSQPDNFAL